MPHHKTAGFFGCFMMRRVAVSTAINHRAVGWISGSASTMCISVDAPALIHPTAHDLVVKLMTLSCKALTPADARNPRLKAEEVGWIRAHPPKPATLVDALTLIHPTFCLNFLFFMTDFRE
jgi:hypothetical protein